MLQQQGGSKLVNPAAHAAATLLCLGFIFEIFVFARTPHTRYHVVKQLSIY